MRTTPETTYRWSAVTDDYSEIVAELAVPGANPVGIEIDAVGFDLAVTMNDVAMARSHDERVRFEDGETILEARARIDHDRIPRWWASHVASGERTEISIEPVVTAEGLLGDRELTVAGSTFPVETDIPDAIGVDDGPSKEVLGQTVVALDDVTAHWVDVDLDTTEMGIEATIANGTSVPLPFDRLDYRILMNDVLVGEGRTRDVTIDANGTTTVDTRARFDNETIREWWPSHLRRGERTEVAVDLEATVSVFGRERTVDYRYVDVFETELLVGSGRR